MSTKIRATLLLTAVTAALVWGAVCLFTGMRQYATRHFGGTSECFLPVNHKLINVTWKNDSMWYLVRPMHADEKAETYFFQEKSLYGVMNGRVILRESK